MVSHSSVCRLFDSSKQVIIDRVKGHGKCAVYNPSINMDSEVHLHNILLLEDHFISSIWSVVRCTVIDAETSWEPHTALNSITLLKALMSCEGTNTVFNPFSNLRQCLARLDILLRPLSHLTVHLCTLSVLCEKVIVHAVQVAFLFARGSVRIFVPVLADLAFGVLLVREQLRN
jgi:hypothetical protein